MSTATVIEVARRRRFSSEAKRELVLLAFRPGGCVSDVARQAGICSSLLYRWRRMMAQEVAAGADFTPVVLTNSAPAWSDPVVVVEFAAARVLMAADAPAALASAVLRALR